MLDYNTESCEKIFELFESTMYSYVDKLTEEDKRVELICCLDEKLASLAKPSYE